MKDQKGSQCKKWQKDVLCLRRPIFEAQNPNVEQHWKVAAVIHNAVQRYDVKYDARKKTAIQASLDRFSKKVDGIESSKEPKPLSSVSGVSEIAACPLFPVAGDSPALPSPTSSPSCSQ